MNCADFQDFYELYALGLLEEPERSELQSHLDRQCENCTPAVQMACALNATFLSTVPDTDPPAALRARVLAIAGLPERKRSAWGSAFALRWSPLLAGLLLAAVWISYRQQQHAADIAAARQVNEQTAIELRRARAVIDLLDEPETREVTFGKEAVKPPRGRIFLHNQKGVVLIANNLPPLAAGRTYEMWLIPKGGAPRPAGLFQLDPNGTAIHVQAGPIDPNLAAVAVSEEPSAGSPAPTTQPLFAAPVGGR